MINNIEIEMNFYNTHRFCGKAQTTGFTPDEVFRKSSLKVLSKTSNGRLLQPHQKNADNTGLQTRASNLY